MFASAHFLENFNVPMEQPKARLSRHNNNSSSSSSIRSPGRNGQLLSPIPDEKAQGGRRGHGKQKKDSGGRGRRRVGAQHDDPSAMGEPNCTPTLLQTEPTRHVGQGVGQEFHGHQVCFDMGRRGS